MLKINYTKAFLKQFKKLTPSIQKKAKLAIKKFKDNPKDNSLKSHKLGGKLDGFYSFSVDYDYRIVFEINKKKGVVILLKIGNHKIYQ